MKKMKVSDLLDKDLDRAVALCVGAIYNESGVTRPAFWIWPGDPVRHSKEAPLYSTDPGCAHPLMELHKISILWRPEREVWWACVRQDPADEEVMGQDGPTQLIAGMRALVMHKRDEDEDIVEVPSE